MIFLFPSEKIFLEKIKFFQIISSKNNKTKNKTLKKIFLTKIILSIIFKSFS